ncbi:hypothetical protein C8F04DRAFT_1192160 [Mycena alexandri]|uniref:Uncharacterized protein n=1 Tax=Mycena alexandri TaxID=1745969 RepID=A0AAD6WV44_9AGAR|nr:hypothetical protein C8F04DRAFT_1192160 [Mycena alexandri]
MVYGHWHIRCCFIVTLTDGSHKEWYLKRLELCQFKRGLEKEAWSNYSLSGRMGERINELEPSALRSIHVCLRSVCASTDPFHTNRKVFPDSPEDRKKVRSCPSMLPGGIEPPLPRALYVHGLWCEGDHHEPDGKIAKQKDSQSKPTLPRGIKPPPPSYYNFAYIEGDHRMVYGRLYTVLTVIGSDECRDRHPHRIRLCLYSLWYIRVVILGPSGTVTGRVWEPVKPDFYGLKLRVPRGRTLETNDSHREAIEGNTVPVP